MGIQVEPKTARKMLLVRYCDTGGDDSDADENDDDDDGDDGDDGDGDGDGDDDDGDDSDGDGDDDDVKLPTHMTLHGVTKSCAAK